jgi:signal peptidase II
VAEAVTEPARRRCLRLGLGIAAAIIVLDQLTKWWILAAVMAPPQVVTLTPFLNIVLAWNRGISFSLFPLSAPYWPWILAGGAAAIAIALTVWLARMRNRWSAAAIGLVIGGALGNAVDRVRFGAVVDFIQLHWGQYYWPAFNLADSAITVGVVTLLLDALFHKEISNK